MVEVHAGVEAWGAGELGAAAPHFEAAAGSVPGWTPAGAYLAAAVFELGDVNRAVSIATEILRGEPRNAQALMVLGRARMLSAPGEGLELLEKAVELYPFRPVCLLTLGEAYATLGRQAEALALAEQAGDIDPDNTWARQLRDRLRTPGRQSPSRAPDEPLTDDDMSMLRNSLCQLVAFEHRDLGRADPVGDQVLDCGP